MNCSMNFIALGVGYLVFLNATKEQGSLRQAGRIIGLVIIGASLISCLYACMYSSGKRGCPMSKAPMCHFVGKKG